MDTPVAFFIFNRPDLTATVFRAIASARPRRLLIVADGPRSSDDVQKCAQARAIAQNVDWDCEVLTNFADHNIGCKGRVSSGLDWVFANVDEAIILEDDCLPLPAFFRFCEDLLREYRDDSRVMHITGTNLYPQQRLRSSYLFSRLVPIWGWASWRRAWRAYDIAMSAWPQYRQESDLDYFCGQRSYVVDSLEGCYSRGTNTWDGQWAFACLLHNGLSIIPKVNLIRNLGFRPDATHTKASHWLSDLPSQKLDFPLTRPASVMPAPQFDQTYLSLLNGTLAPRKRVVDRVRRLAVRMVRRMSSPGGAGRRVK